MSDEKPYGQHKFHSEWPDEPDVPGEPRQFKPSDWNDKIDLFGVVGEVNGKKPDENGAITLDHTDVGAEAAGSTQALADTLGTAATHDSTDFASAADLNTALANKADLVAGVVPASQLPAYHDEIIWVANRAALPATGVSRIVYITLDKNEEFRWNGVDGYSEISPSIALGETSSTAGRGDHAKTAYDHSQSEHAPADAEKNLQADWAQTDTTADDYIKGKPTLPTLPIAISDVTNLQAELDAKLQSAIPKTYAELETLKNASQLKQGQSYSTFIQNKYLQPYRCVVKVCEFDYLTMTPEQEATTWEQIILTASSANSFNKTAYSVTHVGDVLEYDFNDNLIMDIDTLHTLEEINYDLYINVYVKDSGTIYAGNLFNTSDYHDIHDTVAYHPVGTAADMRRTGFIKRRTSVFNNSFPYDWRRSVWARFPVNYKQYDEWGHSEQDIPYYDGTGVQGVLYRDATTVYFCIFSTDQAAIADNLDNFIPVGDTQKFLAHWMRIFPNGSRTGVIRLGIDISAYKEFYVNHDIDNDALRVESNDFFCNNYFAYGNNNVFWALYGNSQMFRNRYYADFSHNTNANFFNDNLAYADVTYFGMMSGVQLNTILAYILEIYNLDLSGSFERNVHYRSIETSVWAGGQSHNFFYGGAIFHGCRNMTDNPSLVFQDCNYIANGMYQSSMLRGYSGNTQRGSVYSCVVATDYVDNDMGVMENCNIDTEFQDNTSQGDFKRNNVGKSCMRNTWIGDCKEWNVGYGLQDGRFEIASHQMTFGNGCTNIQILPVPDWEYGYYIEKCNFESGCFDIAIRSVQFQNVKFYGSQSNFDNIAVYLSEFVEANSCMFTGGGSIRKGYFGPGMNSVTFDISDDSNSSHWGAEMYMVSIRCRTAHHNYVGSSFQNTVVDVDSFDDNTFGNGFGKDAPNNITGGTSFCRNTVPAGVNGANYPDNVTDTWACGRGSIIQGSGSNSVGANAHVNGCDSAFIASNATLDLNSTYQTGGFRYARASESDHVHPQTRERIEFAATDFAGRMGTNTFASTGTNLHLISGYRINYRMQVRNVGDDTVYLDAKIIHVTDDNSMDLDTTVPVFDPTDITCYLKIWAEQIQIFDGWGQDSNEVPYVRKAIEGNWIGLNSSEIDNNHGADVILSAIHETLVDTDGSTYTLEPANTCKGRKHTIKANISNVCYLRTDPESGDYIDYDGCVTIPIAILCALTVQSDGTNWQVIGQVSNPYWN